MKREQLAVQLYTLRKFTQTAESLDETLAKVAAMGYKAVQVSAIGPIEPKQVKASADRHGLRICATHVGYNRLKEDLERVIDEHKLWDCRYVGLGMMPGEFRETPGGYDLFAAECSAIAERIRDAGLQFVYHNHRFEFERTGEGARVTGMERLMEQTAADAFHFELDTYWAQAGGADPAAWIRKLDGRMKVVHLKDMEVVDDQAVYAEVGHGNMNWDAILAACRETGMEWYIVEQDECRRDPFESLAMSYEYLAERAKG
ncbi:sugar phosphate isomerase/epimerase [Paenibacillus sambharensis]|uniref:Sugar phosphate isomerase/epimerase n=1 Tax=Paenibacillus sambharensis TaxID=1803190 RepID=A0A2W1L6M9_9BACL|nr:sugar phosphate isomerase/epimerase [Paenibacillus sambharensis]PZD93770.1 sugar phosphate isomerase/epimerase [Paenibacillus sambharensis]